MAVDLELSLDVNELLWMFVFIFLVQNSDFLVVMGNFILMVFFKLAVHGDAEE